MGVRVWDRRASEGRPVMGRIRAGARRESGLTSARSLVTRERGKAAKEASK